MKEPQIKNTVFSLYIPMCTASLAVYACGTALGWTSPMIPKLNGQIDAKNNPLFEPLTKQQETWLGSLLPLGATFSAIFFGYLVHKIGIKYSFIIAIIPLLLVFPMPGYTRNVEIFYLFRTLSGFGVGGVFTVLSIFISQIENDKDRKLFGFLMQIFVNLGIFFSYTFGSTEAVPIFNLLCLITPTLLIILVTISFAQSSYPFVTTDKTNDAEAKLQINTEKIAQKELDNFLNKSATNQHDILQIFKSSATIKALLISITLVLVQQLSGIYVILFYADTIIRENNISKTTSHLTQYLIIIMGLVLIIVSIFHGITGLTNKRHLLTIGALGMGISHSFLGYYFHYFVDQDITMFLFLCLVMYIIFFSIGFGQLTWTFIGELLPSHVKSTGIALTISCNWLFAFITTKFIFDLSSMIQMEIVCWMLAIICYLGVIVINVLVPENGKILSNNYEILMAEQI